MAQSVKLRPVKHRVLCLIPRSYPCSASTEEGASGALALVSQASSLKESSRPRSWCSGMLLRVILWPQYLGTHSCMPLYTYVPAHIQKYTHTFKKIGVISFRKRNSVFSCSGFDSVVNPQHSCGIDSRTWEMQDCPLSLHKMACMIFASSHTLLSGKYSSDHLCPFSVNAV